MRLETVLLAHCRDRSDKVALVYGDERVTFGALGERIRKVAAGLRARGLENGARVVLYLPNGITFVEAFFGTLAAGGVPVPVTTRLSLHELEYICKDSEAAAVVCDASVAEEVSGRISSYEPQPVLYVDGDSLRGATRFQDLHEAAIEPLPVLPVEQDEAVIVYTSGTTGRPKGAVLTHANILIQHGLINAVQWGVSGEDRYLVVTPMAHRAGIGRLINATMLGATLVIESHFDPVDVLEIIEREQVTIFGLVPTMCRLLMPELEKAPGKASSLRMLTVTGEAFPVSLKARIMELLPDTRMTSFFGMTEVGGVTTLSHEEQLTHADSVGRISPGVEARIVDESGVDVSPGDIGELWVRTGRPGAFTVMKEYLGQPEQSAAALTDGWFHTGDLARFDEEEYLYIVDRKKEMVLSGGFNIYSKEVELTILDMPGVRDVAVIGLPDPVFGEAVAAVIEYDPDRIPPTRDEVISHCRARIASYKKPKYVFYRESLPRNSTGKVRKIDLVAELSEDGSLADGVGEGNAT